MKQSIVKCPGCGLMLPNQYVAEPPRFRASGECMELFNQLSAVMTIQDVLQAEAGEPRDAKIRQWVRAAWNSWAHAHDWVKEAARPVLEP